MSVYIDMILRDKAEIEAEMKAVIAPYKAKLEEADIALKALGYKEGSFPFNTKTMAELDKPTIKQRVTQALTVRYPDGAHYTDILDYINERWTHLPVKRTSLSPQLTRLRKKQVIYLDEEKGIWHLVDDREAINSSTPIKGAEGDAINASLFKDSGG